MEYCCHVWAGAPSCYLELLDKLQKRTCRTVGPSFAASIEFCFYILLYIYRSTRYSDRLHVFSVTIPRCYKDVNSFFPLTARLYNSLPIECFSLTYNLNDFKSVNILSRLNFNKFTFVKIIFVMNNGCYNMIQQQALSSGKPWKIKMFMLHF